jgi:hypothetical protein
MIAVTARCYSLKHLTTLRRVFDRGINKSVPKNLPSKTLVPYYRTCTRSFHQRRAFATPNAVACSMDILVKIKQTRHDKKVIQSSSSDLPPQLGTAQLEVE